MAGLGKSWNERRRSGLPRATTSLLTVGLLMALAGCGGGDSGGKAAAGGAGNAGTGDGATDGGSDAGRGGSGPSTGGQAGTKATGGGGAAGTSGGGRAGGAGGDAGPPVPRVENTDGTSVLERPRVGTTDDGKCPRAEVFCNGECLATDLDTAGTCTVLKLGLHQTAELALTADALYYTAVQREILKLDLATGTHTSLVRGLTFANALTVEGEWLYFSTIPADALFEYDVRRVALTGGDVTVLSPQLPSRIGAIVPLADQLLLGVGDFDLDLFTVPKAGGPASSFGGVQRVSYPLLDGDTLYYRGEQGLYRTSVTTPGPGQALNQQRSNARFVLEGDYLYYAHDDGYFRLPTAGGTPEMVQALAKTFIVGRSPTEVIITRVAADDEEVTELLAMPVAGGEPRQLATIESQELQDVVADASNVYVAVGVVAAGAILRIPLE